MTPSNRALWVEWTAARYLTALEDGDLDAQDDLWELAAGEPDLEAAFEEVHADLAAEAAEAAASALAAEVDAHLPSARVDVMAGPVTAAEVADELFRSPPGRLSPAAHALNERLRACPEPVPDDLGVSKLAAWGARHGDAPLEYWKAFKAAAMLLVMRRASADHYSLAARKARGAS